MEFSQIYQNGTLILGNFLLLNESPILYFQLSVPVVHLINCNLPLQEQNC